MSPVLLFPEPDVLCVAAPSNPCTWLPLLVFCQHQDRKEKTRFHSFRAAKGARSAGFLRVISIKYVFARLFLFFVYLFIYLF